MVILGQGDRSVVEDEAVARLRAAAVATERRPTSEAIRAALFNSPNLLLLSISRNSLYNSVPGAGGGGEKGGVC